jgi:hypothetical protein
MYEPLIVMRTTGAARLDPEGCIVESGEYVAALYESAAADAEYVEANNRHPGNAVPGDYAHAAQVLAEELWTRDVESLS